MLEHREVADVDDVTQVAGVGRRLRIRLGPALIARPAGELHQCGAAVERALGAVPASVHLVPVDFERDELMDRLVGHGYSTGARTFFIWEGVTQYLTEDAVRATLTALQGAPAGSLLVFTYVRKDFIDGSNMICRTSPWSAWSMPMRPCPCTPRRLSRRRRSSGSSSARTC